MENEKSQTEQTQPIPETLNLVEKAEAAAKAIKEQNDRYEMLVKRNEEAAARAMLGGGTNSGQQPAPVPVETAKDYAKRVMHEK